MAPSNDDPDDLSDEQEPAHDERAHAPRRDPVTDGKKELSALWGQALSSIDEIRDAIVRGSHAGRAKLDAQLLIRQRDKLLAQLGRQLLDDVAHGHPMPAGCEELAKRVAQLDADIATAEADAQKALKR